MFYSKSRYSLAFTVALAISTSGLSGQGGTKEFSKADDLFLNERFSLALPYYLQFLETEPSNADLNYKTGICYLNSRSQKLKAIKYLEKAAGASGPVIAHKILGDAYCLSGKYDLAIASYEKFKKIFSPSRAKDDSVLQEVNWKIKMCKLGKKLQTADTSMSDLHADHIDYSSSFSANQSELILTFHKPGDGSTKLAEDEKYFEDIYIPLQKELAGSPKISIDTSTNKNEAEIATSMNGQIVLTYRDDQGDGNLYISRLAGNQWTDPEKLSKPINTKGWEPNEFITEDGYRLYFVSNRAGGFGGKDIYVCKKMQNGEWGKAINLGPVINSPFDEEAPFIYSDGHTLFFSSNENKPGCCFNIFRSTLSQDGSWIEPTKIGYPVKIVSDSSSPAKKEDKGTSSVPINEDVYDKKNMYLATFIDQKKSSLTVLKGKVLNTYGDVLSPVRITVTDNETGEALAVYNSNYKTGDYIITLLSGKNNNITYSAQGYLFQSENVDMGSRPDNYELHKLVQLHPVVTGSKTVLNNIFFDFDRSTMRSISNVELNKLFLMLSEDPGMEIELSYYFDAKENLKYYAKLAEERAQSVVNYLIEKGISKERLIVKDPGKIKSKAVKIKSDKKAVIEEKPLGPRLELTITNLN